MDASDWWSRVIGLHPSPRARGSMASDFLTGRTEEEFPQKQRQFKRHWAAQDEESSMDGWWRWLHNNVNVLDTTELHA